MFGEGVIDSFRSCCTVLCPGTPMFPPMFPVALLYASMSVLKVLSRPLLSVCPTSRVQACSSDSVEAASLLLDRCLDVSPRVTPIRCTLSFAFAHCAVRRVYDGIRMGVVW